MLVECHSRSSREEDDVGARDRLAAERPIGGAGARAAESIRHIMRHGSGLTRGNGKTGGMGSSGSGAAAEVGEVDDLGGGASANVEGADVIAIKTPFLVMQDESGTGKSTLVKDLLRGKDGTGSSSAAAAGGGGLAAAPEFDSFSTALASQVRGYYLLPLCHHSSAIVLIYCFVFVKLLAQHQGDRSVVATSIDCSICGQPNIPGQNYHMLCVLDIQTRFGLLTDQEAIQRVAFLFFFILLFII